MSQQEDVARFRQDGLRHHERAGARERQRDDPFKGTFEHRASGHLQDPGVEPLVEIDEPLERFVVGSVDHLLDRVADSRRACTASGLAPRSAANRAAVPSSTPRSSIASLMSACVNSRTTYPREPALRTSPSCSSAASARRSGVRETPSVSTNRSSDIRSPGANSPRRISSRRRSSARVIWVLLSRPATSHLPPRHRDVASRQSRPAVRLHAKRTAPPLRTLILEVVLGAIACN